MEGSGSESIRIFLKFTHHIMSRNKLCVVCREVIDFYGRSIKLSCGRHYTHEVCFGPAICLNGGQVTEDGDICSCSSSSVERKMVNVGFTYKLIRNVQSCMYCTFVIDYMEGGYELDGCQHCLHPTCLLMNIKKYGLSCDGKIFCDICK